MLVLRLAADRENSIRNFLSPLFPLFHVNKVFIHHYTLTYTGHFSICIIFHSHWHWLINLIQAGFLILSTFFSPLYFVTLYIPLYIGKSHSNIWFLRVFSYNDTLIFFVRFIAINLVSPLFDFGIHTIFSPKCYCTLVLFITHTRVDNFLFSRLCLSWSNSLLSLLFLEIFFHRKYSHAIKFSPFPHQHIHPQHWTAATEESSTIIAERCQRARINSAIFVSSEGRGFDSIEFIRRYGSQSVLCRKTKSAENIPAGNPNVSRYWCAFNFQENLVRTLNAIFNLQISNSWNLKLLRCAN